jgi:hypothetical protein
MPPTRSNAGFVRKLSQSAANIECNTRECRFIMPLHNYAGLLQRRRVSCTRSYPGQRRRIVELTARATILRPQADDLRSQ